MMKKKILITGASGLLGSNLALAYKDKYEVAGIYNQHKIKIGGVEIINLDLLDRSRLKRLIDDFNPDVIIHSAALSDVDKCETDKALADRLNIEATENIVRSLGNAGPYLIYVSTDAVYDGIKGNFGEDDEANPINHYARTKLLGEKTALKYKDSMVARTNFFGWNIQDKFSLSEWAFHSLSNKKPIKGFKDVYFSAMYTFFVADILEKVFNTGLNGIYNLGSSDSMSKYDFALRIAETFNLNKSLIEKISVDDFDFTAKRSKNVSMNVKKIEKAINFGMPAMDLSISAFYKDYKDGIQSKLKRGPDGI